MNRFDIMQIAEFLDVLSSASPVPGGGGASALAGAIGASLGNMVGSLTIGKKKYEDVEEKIQDLNKQSKELRYKLLDLIQEDAEGFRPLADAYRLPSKTEEEKTAKQSIMEKELYNACLAPIEIMKKCCEVIELCGMYAQIGSKLALSDAGVGVMMSEAALKGAALNIFINTKSMTNRQKAEELNSSASKMINEYSKKAEEIYEFVKNKII